MNENVRDFLPYPLNVSDLGLHTQFALRSDFSSDLLDLRSEHGQLVDHVVDSIDQAQHLSGDGDANYFLTQISTGDSGLRIF